MPLLIEKVIEGVFTPAQKLWCRQDRRGCDGRRGSTSWSRSHTHPPINHTFMKTIIHPIQPLVLTLLALGSFLTSTLAQEVSIPDPGLNAVIREALGKPSGPLTVQDMLSLTSLNARNRNVSSIDGLEAARNLTSLDLQINHLTSFSLPADYTNLLVLDISVNPL